MKTLTLTNIQEGNISSRISSNSEANVSELLENLEEMFPLYYTGSDFISGDPLWKSKLFRTGECLQWKEREKLYYFLFYA